MLFIYHNIIYKSQRYYHSYNATLYNQSIYLKLDDGLHNFEHSHTQDIINSVQKQHVNVRLFLRVASVVPS